jgi:N-acetylglutamate synthase-like GNAT family acetyltransferase/mannose-6-phosphate isomerase-like protein (cupin superfamily)
MNDVKYTLAAPADLPAIQALLADCGLPIDGLDGILENCLVARLEAKLVGTIALERCGRSALLRSLAVAPECRGRSLGRNLCAKMVSYAHLAGIDELYLLTTNAELYFAALGFTRVERSVAPAPIQATSQFRSLCPKSAVCMRRNIVGEVIHASTELLRLRPDVPGSRMWAVSLKNTMLTYFEVDPHSRFEPHSHESEQITMVLSGELFFQMSDVVHCVKPGEVIAIPSSVPHAVWTEALPVTAFDAWSPVMRKYESAELIQRDS